jgi:hypothetical protein
MSERLAEGKKAVDRFRQRLNQEQYTSIYGETDELFRGKSSEQEFTAVLTAVHRKLGAFQRAENQGTLVNASTNGAFLQLTYKTRFSGGDATEVFRWRLGDGACKLVSYHINSTALITK